jgi:hypothetical protein
MSSRAVTTNQSTTKNQQKNQQRKIMTQQHYRWQKNIALFLTVLLTTYTAHRAQAQGRLEFERGQMYDWGVVPTPVVTAEIRIKNVGSEPLTITNIQTSCGCMVAQPQKMTLQAGESTVMNATMTMLSHDGEHNQTVTLTTAPVPTSYTMSLRAVLRRPLTILPPTALSLFYGKETSASAKVINTSDSAIVIKSLRSYNGVTVLPSLVKRLPLTLQRGDTLVVPFTMKPEQQEVNYFMSTIDIETNQPTQLADGISLRAVVQPASAAPAVAPSVAKPTQPATSSSSATPRKKSTTAKKR